MKEKREKMIRDYLYEEGSNKTLTAKDIVSRIDFSTPQVKPQVRRKKKRRLKSGLPLFSETRSSTFPFWASSATVAWRPPWETGAEATSAMPSVLIPRRLPS